MSLFLIFGLLLIAGSSCSASTRIVGGEDASIEQYSSLVQVDYFSVSSQIWDQNCAANILTSRYVLSAAHCFEGNNYSPALRRIRAGTSYRNVGGVIIYVQQELNHPNYGLYGLDSDISVVRLQTPLVFNDVIRPIAIIASGVTLPDNLPVVHAGWGHLQNGGPASPVLQHVTVYIINHALCQSRYQSVGAILTSNMICAGILDVSERDACQQDSGGPLYYGDLLVGIISGGMRCADPIYPGFSTDISKFTDWIVATAV